MKTLSFVSMLLVAGVLSGAVQAKSSDVTSPDAPRALPAEGPVDVRWSDPAQFSEIRLSGNRREAARGDWVRQLALYVRKRAATELSPGQHLEVTFEDIKRAGMFEPGRVHLNSTRIVREIYPPRIQLSFKLTDTGGNAASQGERKLTDLSFMQNASTLDSDPLRYEKRLIDDWVRREFKSSSARAAGSR